MKSNWDFFLYYLVNLQSKNMLLILLNSLCIQKYFSKKHNLFLWVYYFFIHTTQSSNKMIPRDQTSDLGPEGNGFSLGTWSLVLKIPCAITSGAKYDGYLKWYILEMNNYYELERGKEVCSGTFLLSVQYDLCKRSMQLDEQLFLGRILN